jgi:hypothetical protein
VAKLRLSLVVLLSVALVAGCGSDLPEPRGDWSEGAQASATRPGEDCDQDDLYAGDVDCADAHYAAAFGHVGITTKAEFGEEYGFASEGGGTKVKRRKRKKR